MQPIYDPTTTPVLDEQVMAQLLDLDDGQTGLLAEMYDLYRQDMPDRLALLAEAIEATEWVQIAETAHAVKGASSTMGVPRGRALAARLEAAGRKEDLGPEDLAELLVQLRLAYEESLDALEAFIAAQA